MRNSQKIAVVPSFPTGVLSKVLFFPLGSYGNMGSNLIRLARGLGSRGMENGFQSNGAVVCDGGRPPAMQDQAVNPRGAISRVSRPRHSLDSAPENSSHELFTPPVQPRTRRTREEVYGSVPTRSLPRRRAAEVLRPDPTPMPITQGRRLRYGPTHLTALDKAMFIMAVEEGVRRGVPKAKTTEAWGLHKNAYSVYKKQYEDDDLEPKKITGRPPEFNEEVRKYV